MVAVTRSAKIYFQTPWILAQYTFEFPLTLFSLTHRSTTPTFASPFAFSLSLSIPPLLLLALNILACSTFIVYFKLYAPLSDPRSVSAVCVCIYQWMLFGLFNFGTKWICNSFVCNLLANIPCAAVIRVYNAFATNTNHSKSNVCD